VTHKSGPARQRADTQAWSRTTTRHALIDGIVRRKRFGGVAVAASAAAALAMTATGDAAVTAPHFMNIFPSRDFVHIEGYDPGEQVTVTVHHDAALIRSHTGGQQLLDLSTTAGNVTRVMLLLIAAAAAIVLTLRACA